MENDHNSNHLSLFPVMPKITGVPNVIPNILQKDKFSGNEPNRAESEQLHLKPEHLGGSEKF
jgi:hypothetical protein